MFEITQDVQIRLAKTAAALLLPWIARALVMAAVNRRTQDPRWRYQWRKGTQYVAAAIVVAAVGRVWLNGLETITTVIGLVGAGLAVALNQPISNIAGWLLIVARRPFEVGDRIQIGSTRGDVIDVGVFQFTLMEIGNWVDAEQSTGRIIHVPNSKVFVAELANYNRGFAFIWIELAVMLTFESDWQRAKVILGEIATEVCGDVPKQAAEHMSKASNRYMLRQGTLTPIVYTSVREFGVLLTVRMLAAPNQRRTVEEAVWERVLIAFAQETDVAIAYPTRRIFDHRTEAKQPRQTPADSSDAPAP